MVYTSQPVFSLPTAVVSMELQVGFPKSVVLKVVVEKADDAIPSLPNVHAFIHQVVYL